MRRSCFVQPDRLTLWIESTLLLRATLARLRVALLLLAALPRFLRTLLAWLILLSQIFLVSVTHDQSPRYWKL
jgi:hypothetical protein